MEKQIEEMAMGICKNVMPSGNCHKNNMPCDLECVYGVCVKRLYEAGYRKQEWISVEERLPNEYERVIGCVTKKVSSPVSGECFRVGNRFQFPTLGYNRPISYWMPLPEPPKGE